jgi:hypothetical protein
MERPFPCAFLFVFIRAGWWLKKKQEVKGGKARRTDGGHGVASVNPQTRSEAKWQIKGCI